MQAPPVYDTPIKLKTGHALAFLSTVSCFVTVFRFFYGFAIFFTVVVIFFHVFTLWGKVGKEGTSFLLGV